MWSKCNGMGKKGGSVKKVVKTKAYPFFRGIAFKSCGFACFKLAGQEMSWQRNVSVKKCPGQEMSW